MRNIDGLRRAESSVLLDLVSGQKSICKYISKHCKETDLPCSLCIKKWAKRKYDWKKNVFNLREIDESQIY